jgi:hypothetical protein
MKSKVKADNYIVFLTVFFLLITLVPFIIQSFYNVPLADDYIYAREAIDRGFFQGQIYWYTHWTGRYFATLLISANPLYLGWTAGNAIIPIVSIAAFCFSLYYFIKSFTILKVASSLVIFILLIMLYISNLHIISQALYWMPGLYTYLLGIIFFLFTWGHFMRVYNGTHSVSLYTYLIPLVLLVMMMGTSEVMIFYNNYIAFVVMVFSYYHKKNKFGFASFLFIVSMVFGLASLLAPGNFVRQNFTTSGNTDYFLQVKRTLDISLTILLPKYVFNLPCILAMLFIALFVSKEKLNSYPATKPKMKPLVLALLLFGGFIVTFLPHAIANTSELRAFNFSYFTFLLALVISVVYTSYYYNVARYVSHIKLKRTLTSLSYFLLLVAVLVFPKNNILLAYSDVYSGKLQCYLNEQNTRNNYLSTQQGKHFVALPPLTCKPKSLFFWDIRPEIKHWENQGPEMYFKIDTVVTKIDFGNPQAH